MAREILSPLQKKFISLFSVNRLLSSRFYLTGGTALSAYYLKHRYSEDLDFFSFSQVDISELGVFLKTIKRALQIKKTDFQQSFNRNLFFLHTKRQVLKIEFTYFPFEQIARPAKKDGICVDSITDIAVNKAFTILQRPRSRDFIDLYCLFERYRQFSFPKLIKMARIKFDAQIDPIQLGAQLIKAQDIQDLPRMIIKLNHPAWRAFFVAQAKRLSKEILT